MILVSSEIDSTIMQFELLHFYNNGNIIVTATEGTGETLSSE